MSDLLEETKSDYIEIKKLEYFKKALPFIIIGTIIVITTMLINDWWNSRIIANNQKMGDLFIKAIQSNDKNLLDESLNLIIKDDSTGIADIARLVRLQENFSRKDEASSLANLQEIAKEAKNDLTKAYARLVWMNIVIDKKEISTLEAKGMAEYISYFKDDSIPFFGSASIINALYKIRNNDLEGARVLLKQLLNSNDISRTVQDQANSILSNL